jgi:hypothetical protein
VGPSGDQAIKAREELTYCRVLKIVAVSLLIASVNFVIAQEKRRPSTAVAPQPAQTTGEQSWILFHVARCWQRPLLEAS